MASELESALHNSNTDRDTYLREMGSCRHLFAPEHGNPAELESGIVTGQLLYAPDRRLMWWLLGVLTGLGFGMMIGSFL